MKQAEEIAAQMYALKYGADDKVLQAAMIGGFVTGVAWKKEQGIDWISVSENGLPPCTIFGSSHKNSVEVLVTNGERVEKSHYYQSPTLQGWYRIAFVPTHYAFINLPNLD